MVSVNATLWVNNGSHGSSSESFHLVNKCIPNFYIIPSMQCSTDIKPISTWCPPLGEPPEMIPLTNNFTIKSSYLRGENSDVNGGCVNTGSNKISYDQIHTKNEAGYPRPPQIHPN